MIGLVLSVFFGLILIARGKRWQDAYRKSTGLLFWWNLVVTISLITIWFSGTVFVAGLGGLFSGALGFLVGLTGGALALSALMFFIIVMSIIQTLGTIFLNRALIDVANDGYRWKRGTLAVGVIFFTLGLAKVFG